MDARQPAPPFTRPPDRHLIHNPNHQPPATAAAAAAATHAYPSYPPSTQPQPQPQPPLPGQHPLHVPYAASNDPYATSRRDPFLPQASHHVRQRSHGAVEGVSHVHAERNGNWGNTGTQYNGGLSWGPWHSISACLRPVHTSALWVWVWGPVRGRSGTARMAWHGCVHCAETWRREGRQVLVVRTRRAQRPALLAAGHVDLEYQRPHACPGCSCGLNFTLSTLHRLLRAQVGRLQCPCRRSPAQSLLCPERRLSQPASQPSLQAIGLQGQHFAYAMVAMVAIPAMASPHSWLAKAALCTF
jgi:hypothetical protein